MRLLRSFLHCLHVLFTRTYAHNKYPPCDTLFDDTDSQKKFLFLLLSVELRLLRLMRIRCLFFGSSRTHAGCPSLDIELQPPCSLSDFRLLLLQRIHSLASLTFVLSVDQSLDYLSEESVDLSVDCEIAVIPPVSGG